MNHFSCLSGKSKSRRESHPDHEPYSPRGGAAAPWTMHCFGIERSWSGGLAQPPHAHLRETRPTSMNVLQSPSSGHRKVSSTEGTLFGGLDVRQAANGEMEPRLVRSRGMRRDWSFEDLGGCQQLKPQVSG